MNDTTSARIARRLNRTVLAAALCLGGAAPLLRASAEESPQNAAKARDPLEYVAPELREGIAAFTRTMATSGFKGINAETLVQVREGGKRFERPFLAEPEVVQKSIPGPAGAPEVPVYVIGAKAGAARPAILHVHGGGYIAGTAKSDVARLQSIATTHDCVIVTVDYRLAPETPFPGSLEDNYAALKWLSDNATALGVDRTRIIVMGESAGGGHAAMLALAARDRAEIPIKQQILVYPMLDDRTGSSVQTPEWIGHYMWTAESNRFGWTSLLGVPAGSASVPPGSVPARVEDLAGLPPTFIGVGSIDLFVNEDVEYARRLIQAGVPTELLVVPGAFHGFQMMAPDGELSKRFNAAVDAAITRAFAP